jgi:hypothetical protein
MCMEKMQEINFKFPRIMRFLLNVGRKIIIDFNAHTVYTVLVYSKVR